METYVIIFMAGVLVGITIMAVFDAKWDRGFDKKYRMRR